MPAGRVIRTDPAQGTASAQGTAVTLVVSTGPPTSAVPDVGGATEAEARQTLTGAGFQVALDPQCENPHGQRRARNRGRAEPGRRRSGRAGFDRDPHPVLPLAPWHDRASCSAGHDRRPVRIDSGWNCTPSTSCSRWRSPMMVPSSVSAVTSRTSGSAVAVDDQRVVAGGLDRVGQARRRCRRPECRIIDVLPCMISPARTTCPPYTWPMHWCPRQTPSTGRPARRRCG